jgi:hypothetical protein
MQRFWDKVEKTDGCWNWTGAKSTTGYGCFVLNGKTVKPHRYVMGFPKGCVLHHCDNRACVNPDHLYIGTYADNARDAVKRGRMHKLDNRGEKNSQAKLDWGKVREIRELLKQGITQRKIAEMYSVSQGTIMFINTGKTWADG